MDTPTPSMLSLPIIYSFPILYHGPKGCTRTTHLSPFSILQGNVHVWVARRAASVTLCALMGATSMGSLPFTLDKMAQVASSN